MFDIITFGSATVDIFLKPKGFKILKGKDFVTLRGICFPVGSKIEIEDIFFFTGGGGTNTAATFAKQGFNVAYFGCVGNDIAGQEVIDDLKKFGINTNFLLKTDEAKTNHSIVLTALKSRQDRTILVYRGASEVYGEERIPWGELNAKWIYLAPLSGKLCSIFEKIIDFAKSKGMKVAANPGNCQLSLAPAQLKKVLGKIDILILNQEEASLLTKIPYQKEQLIFKKLDELCPRIVIMTRGENGVTASDGKTLYRAEALRSKVIDRTGAGDSFGAGFVSAFIRTDGDIEQAIQLGIANSSSCLTELGAKNGLLAQNSDYKKVGVKREHCAVNNLCAVKGKK